MNHPRSKGGWSVLRKIAWLVLALLVLAPAASAQQVLNIYNWSDYIDPSVIADFEKEYGIRVIYNVFSNNEELHARLRAGATGRSEERRVGKESSLANMTPQAET